MRRANYRYAYGYCDRLGTRHPLNELVEEYVQGRPTGLRVWIGAYDPDHPQNWLGRLGDYTDPELLDDPRPDLTEEESRRMFSFDPVGVGNVLMIGSIGQATV